MDADYPLRELNLVASSVSDDLGFVALADIAAALESTDASNECRLIGGNMVMLHVYRWGLGPELFRETLDADIGIANIALNRIDAVGLLRSLGYHKVSGCRFEKEVGEASEKAIIDVLVPSYTSRARKSVKVGGLVTTEVPGLANALRRDPVEIRLRLHRLNGEHLTAALNLPDEVAALGLKTEAFNERSKGKDAVDVWRCMEVMYRAGASLSKTGDLALAAVRDLLAQGFAKQTSSMMSALVEQQGLSKQAAQQRYTRIQALMKQVL